MRNYVYRLIVALGGCVFRLLALRLTVRGAEHLPARGGAVLAVSHFSYLDFALAEWAVWRAGRRYTRFMATKASFRHPVVGPLMRSMRHIPVDRDAGAAAYAHALEVLETGDLVGVFPETRVSASFTLLPFKTGAARLAAESGAPIVPCVIWGSHRVLTRTHRFSVRGAFRTPVLICFGEPMFVTPDTESSAATATLQAKMDALLSEAQVAYPHGSPPGAWWVPAHLGGGAPTTETPTTQETPA